MCVQYSMSPIIVYTCPIKSSPWFPMKFSPVKVLFLLPVFTAALILPDAAIAETLSIGVSHSEYLPPAPTLHAKVAVPAHYHSDALQGRAAATTAAAPALKSETMITEPIQAPIKASVQATAPAAPPPAKQAPPTLARPVVEWFPIPAAMAGVWTKRGDLTTSVTDLRSGMSQPLNQWTEDEMTVTWGHQSDKQGNVWHANLLPAERDGLSAGKSVKFLTVGQKCEGMSGNTIVTRTHYLVSESYGAGGPVADIFQQEALNHYQVVSAAELQNNSTNRVFSYHGQPVRDGVLLSRFSRVGAYSPTSSMHGIDLVQSLNTYLQSINRQDLAR